MNDDDIEELGPLEHAFQKLEHYSPEFEVWNYLESAVDQARSEMNELPPDYRKALEAVARLKAHKHHRLLLSSAELAARRLRFDGIFVTSEAGSIML